MKGKNLLLLVAVAIVAVGMALWSSRQRGIAPPPDVVGSSVLPDLPVNTIHRLTVTTTKQTVTLVKKNGTWIAPDKYDFPADTKKIHSVLRKVANLEIGRVVTGTPLQLRDLNLTVPSENTAQAGILLTLSDHSGKTVGELLVGSEHMYAGATGAARFAAFPDGQYVSPDRGKTAVLVKTTLLEVTGDLKNWLQAELTSIPEANVAEITITQPGTTVLKLTRPDKNAELTVTDLKDNEESESTYKVAAALNFLAFSDIADPALSDTTLGMDKPTVYQAITKDDTLYTVSIGGSPKDTKDRYARFSVNPKDNSTEPSETIQKLTKRFEGRTFVIPEHRASAMCSTRITLVKKKESTDDPAPRTD